MNSSILFYEDSGVDKRNWGIGFTILCICFIGWSISVALTFIDPFSEALGENFIEDPLSFSLPFIIFLSFMLFGIIALLVHRVKSNKYRRSIQITTEQFCFTYYKNDKDIFSVNEFVTYDIIGKSRNFGIVRLYFKNCDVITMRTRQFDYLLSVLYQILKQNYERNNTDVNQKA